MNVSQSGLLALMSCLFVIAPTPSHAEEDSGTNSQTADALALFESRIMPIFKSPDPSSCVQCHLSSVDLKDYILPSHTATFVALRQDGLVDVANPSKSKILNLIAMGERDSDSMARRLHEKARQAEFDAFSAWIHACCADKTLVAMSKLELAKTVGPSRPLKVVRHNRKSRVIESFTQKIWSQRMRCFPCHTPDEIDKDNPKHKVAAKRHQDYVRQYGARMNLFRETPEQTLAALVASSRSTKPGELPLINLDDPSLSLIVLKPTAKLPPKQEDGSMQKPSSREPVSHMGGLKMHPDDHSYKLFLSWLQDYAAVVGDEYQDVDSLPQDNWIATQRILRLKGVPQEWPRGTVVQLFVHAKQRSGKWSDNPVAFTQGTVTPRGMVNGALLLIASNLTIDPNDADFPLAAGDYLVRAYVDTKRRIAAEPTTLLHEQDFVGQAVVSAQWQPGFPNAETFSADELQQSH